MGLRERFLNPDDHIKPRELDPGQNVPYFKNPYKYRDDEESFNKIASFTFFGAYVGTAYGIIDVVGRSRTTTLPTTIARFSSLAVPAAMMGAVFGTTIVVASSIRGKNDAYNHMLAGCGAGVVLGVRTKSMKIGSGFCLGLGAAALVARNFDLDGYTKHIIPDSVRKGVGPEGPGLFYWQNSFDPWRKEVNRDIER